MLRCGMDAVKDAARLAAPCSQTRCSGCSWGLQRSSWRAARTNDGGADGISEIAVSARFWAAMLHNGNIKTKR